MSAQKDILFALSELIEQLHEKTEVVLDIPEDYINGDYSSSIALKLSKKMGKPPREIAEEIKQKMEKYHVESLERVEVAGPGFINFYLSKSYLISGLNLIREQKDKFGESNTLQEKKIMVEFTDPNPLKEFHIGHLYSNAVGESVSRLLESQGAEVVRACYQGDVGMHVAKALFGIMSFGLKIDEMQGESLPAKAKFLGEAYALGAKKYEESDEIKKEIGELNKKIYNHDPEVYPLYEQAKEWSLLYFEQMYERLGTKYKEYYFESKVGEEGVKIVKENLGTVFEEDNGAIIFSKEKSNLHTRVFINSQGLPTYEAKELGLAPIKYEDFPYDQSIIITGNEINEYFKVLLAALSLIRPDLAEKTIHISHGMVRLPSGKMSSRTGDVITGEWLLNETKSKLKTAHSEMSEDVSEKLTIGAVKYALLKVGIGSDITFSFEESINLHGNSGPYIQYSYARTQNVLDKFEKSEYGLTSPDSLMKEEQEVLKKMIHFPEIVMNAAASFSPSILCTYLYDLSQLFNAFYEKHRVYQEDDLTVKNFRRALTESTGYVLGNGLHLLGILSPSKI
ncbi:MAG: arginine--tRNA ligase [Candidatus Levybacteria bacterium]|nr:arginine--tRNA ligase [Candidatus Levybacteria bacterium]MBP9814988.1 arginine--tRNA ligase [Candidatus Levybacteria bacterium]